MTDTFFDHPILNSPYEYPGRHWALDISGQPTGDIEGERRSAKFITPIPKPKRRRGEQADMVFDGEAAALSTADQAYDPTPIINPGSASFATCRWARRARRSRRDRRA